MTEETLFALAREKPTGADRQAFLDEACGGNTALRDRVERLLAADERSRGILEQGPDPTAFLAVCRAGPSSPGLSPHAAPTGEIPRMIQEADSPGYELSEPVGEGGMGVVYRARDTRLNRDVAVKLLHARFDSDGPAAKRFLGEAQVTAQLQHPGVPPVHQVGTLPDGRPFLVMKLIKGRTLADLLADKQADRGRTLAAFEQVCQAVAFAHAHKVIHRDLKPSNVMVGAFGEVQVMDWGLAKVLDASAGLSEQTACDEMTATVSGIDSDRGAGDSTRPGSVLGTPAYMPPEQAIGAVDQIDQRSDVFGLGAILCAILTGRPPYVGADSESTRQLAARVKLDDAFTRLDGCGADPGLVGLCKRCLASDKPDRPVDAGEVAQIVADLRAAAEERVRVAELDRVRAEGERAKAEAEVREQRKRRRVQLALVGSLGLLLAAGGAFGWYSDRQATQRRVLLEQNAEAAAALLDQCEAALRGNRADQAAIALGAAEPRAADGGAEELAGRLDRCRIDLALLRELDDIDVFRWSWAGRSFPDPKLVVARWRAALVGYGVTADEGRVAESAEKVKDSLVRDRVMTALDGWHELEPSAGLRAVLRSADPDKYRNAVREAVAARRGRPVIALADRPEALQQPPWFAAVLGQLEPPEADRRRAILESALRARSGDLNLLMALGGSYPFVQPKGAAERVRWYQAAVAVQPGNLAARLNLGLALQDNGNLDAAMAEYREVIRRDPNFALAHNNLGFGKQLQGDLDGAIASYRDAIRADPKLALAYLNLGPALEMIEDIDGTIAAYEAAIRADPEDPRAHNNLALVLRDWVQDYEGAVRHFEAALRIDPQCPGVHAGLAPALDKKGDWKAAMAAYRMAILLDPTDVPALNNLGVDLREKTRDHEGAIAYFRLAIRLDPKFGMCHDNLGQALRLAGRPDEAIACFKEAIRLSPEYVNAHYNLGATLHREKRDSKGAIPAFEEALRLDPDHVLSHISLGAILRDEKRDLAAATAHFQAAIKVNPKNARAHANQGLVELARGNPNAAIAWIRKAIQLDPEHADFHANLGVVLMTAKQDLDGAIAAFREAIRIDPNHANAHCNLGGALMTKGHIDEGILSLREAIRLDPKIPSAHSNLGVALKQARRWDEAVAAFREVVRLNPKHAPAHHDLGRVLRDKGERDEAILAFREAIQLDPKYAPAHADLAITLHDKRDLNGAIEAYREAIRLNPSDAYSCNNLGNALRDKGDLKGAIASYREAIRLDPKYAGSHNNLGNALRSAGNLDGAIASWKKAIENDRTIFPPHTALAFLLATGPERLRDGKQAVEHATRACELTGWKHPECLSILALAHAEAGDFDKAVELQKQAMGFPGHEKRYGKFNRQLLDLFEQKKPYRDPAWAAREVAPPPRELKP